MSSRTGMMGMLVLFVMAGAAVLYFGTREPERRPPAPVIQTIAKPVEKKPAEPRPKPGAPVAAERPTTQRDAPVRREGPAVEGTVGDKAGTPIGDATIHIGEADAREVAKTGPDGRFALAVAPELGTALTATHPDYLPLTLAFTPGGETPAHVAFQLEKGGSIVGTVLRGGRPASDVKMLETESGKNTTTDAQGYFAFKGLQSGMFDVRVEFGEGSAETAPLAATWLSQEVAVTTGDVSTVDFDLPDCDSAVEGFVIFEGRPFAQAAIAVQVANPRGQYHTNTETGPDGSYHIAMLPDGPTNIQAAIPLANGAIRRKPARLELNVHETLRQDFDFPIAGSVQGQVRGLRAGEQASVLALRGAPQEINKMTFEQLTSLHENVAANVGVASDGSFAFEALDPGEYVLMITASPQGSTDFRSASQAVSVVAGADVSVRIMMR